MVTKVDTPDFGSPAFAEEKLYDVKNDVVGFDSTRDGKLLFWFERAPDGQVIPLVNGTPGASFDSFPDPFERLRKWQRQRLRELLVGSTYTFSADGRHFAYIGRRRKGFFISIDGVQSAEYKAIGGDPYFDPTGSTSFYIAKIDGVNRLVLNGMVQLEYEARGAPVFSPDGSHYAFCARVPGGEAVVHDGRAGPPFAWVPNLVVAPNGRVAYDGALKRRRFQPQRFAFVVDDDVVAESRLLSWMLSPDGRRIYYLDHDSRRCFVDGDLLPEGTKYAEFALDGRLYTVVDDQAFVDGVPLRVPGSDTPVFTPDGRHSAWGAKVGERHVLVRDGEIASPEMDAYVGNVEFSPDGTRLSFRAIEGEYPEDREFMVVDGIEGPRFDLAACWQFSPDSRHFAYVGEDGRKSFLIFDQTPGPPVDTLRMPGAMWPGCMFEFSPDSNHVAAVAILGDHVRPLVDQRLGPRFERLAQPVFQGDGTVSFFACRDNAIFRVRATLD